MSHLVRARPKTLEEWCCCQEQYLKNVPSEFFLDMFCDFCGKAHGASVGVLREGTCNYTALNAVHIDEGSVERSGYVLDDRKKKP